MLTVYKYNLYGYENLITLPKGAEILSTGRNDSGMYIWALVDTEQKTTRRRFIIVETGSMVDHYLSDDEKVEFIGTVIDEKVWYVVHVFEVVKV